MSAAAPPRRFIHRALFGNLTGRAPTLSGSASKSIKPKDFVKMFAGFSVPGTFFNMKRTSCEAACAHEVLTSEWRTQSVPERLEGLWPLRSPHARPAPSSTPTPTPRPAPPCLRQPPTGNHGLSGTLVLERHSRNGDKSSARGLPRADAPRPIGVSERMEVLHVDRGLAVGIRPLQPGELQQAPSKSLELGLASSPRGRRPCATP